MKPKEPGGHNFDGATCCCRICGIGKGEYVRTRRECTTSRRCAVPIEQAKPGDEIVIPADSGIKYAEWVVAHVSCDIGNTTTWRTIWKVVGGNVSFSEDSYWYSVNNWILVSKPKQDDDSIDAARYLMAADPGYPKTIIKTATGISALLDLLQTKGCFGNIGARRPALHQASKWDCDKHEPLPFGMGFDGIMRYGGGEPDL